MKALLPILVVLVCTDQAYAQVPSVGETTGKTMAALLADGYEPQTVQIFKDKIWMPVGEEAVDRFSDDTAPPGAEPAPVSQTATPPITPQRAAASALPLAAPPAPEAAALAAREAVKGISTLEELRTVLDAFEGCALK